jgi:hypothetical protein
MGSVIVYASAEMQASSSDPNVNTTRLREIPHPQAHEKRRRRSIPEWPIK